MIANVNSLSHPDLGLLQSFLDGELEGNEHVKLGKHLRVCPSCAEILAELREASDRFSAAIQLFDTPQPMPNSTADQPRPQLRHPESGHRSARSFLGRAAVLLLVAVGTASAVIPGSPIHEWIVGLTHTQAEDLGGQRGARRQADGNPANRKSGARGVSVLPSAGVLLVRVRGFLPGTTVRLRVVAEAEGYATVAGDESVRFDVADGRIEVTGVGQTEISIGIPRSAVDVSVQVDDRVVARGRGGAIELLVPGRRTPTGELVFLTASR